MKKKILVVCSTILSLSVFCSSFSITAFASEADGLTGGQILKNMITTEYENNIIPMDISQSESDAYNKNIYLNSVVNTDQTLAENYGGSFINDDKELIILLKETQKQQNETILINAIGNTGVGFQTCTYSLNELMALKEYISSFWNIQTDDLALKDLIASMTGVGIYEQENKVFVEIKDCTTEKIELFKSVISNSDAIMFEEIVESENDVGLQPGDEIIIRVNGQEGHYSIGFRCRKLLSSGDYAYGIVTAGHGIAIAGASVYNWIDYYTGYVHTRAYTHNGNTDAAFIRITSDDTFSNLVPYNSVIIKSNAIVTQYATGMTVYKAGITTDVTSGTVKSTSYDTTNTDGITIKDCVKTSYSSEGGDSGGIVYTILNGEYPIAGIHRASVTGLLVSYGCFVKAENIKNALGISFY